MAADGMFPSYPEKLWLQAGQGQGSCARCGIKKGAAPGMDAAQGGEHERLVTSRPSWTDLA